SASRAKQDLALSAACAPSRLSHCPKALYSPCGAGIGYNPGGVGNGWPVGYTNSAIIWLSGTPCSGPVLGRYLDVRLSENSQLRRESWQPYCQAFTWTTRSQ